MPRSASPHSEEPEVGELSERDPDTQFEPSPSDELYEVEKILDETKIKYKVRWAGVDPATGEPWEDSWVPKKDCTDDLVKEWKLRKVEMKKNHRRGSSKAGSVASSSRRPSNGNPVRPVRSNSVATSSTVTDHRKPKSSKVKMEHSPSPPAVKRKRRRTTPSPPLDPYVNPFDGEVPDPDEEDEEPGEPTLKKRRTVQDEVQPSPRSSRKTATELAASLHRKMQSEAERSPSATPTRTRANSPLIRPVATTRNKPVHESQESYEVKPRKRWGKRVPADDGSDPEPDQFEEVPPSSDEEARHKRSKQLPTKIPKVVARRGFSPSAVARPKPKPGPPLDPDIEIISPPLSVASRSTARSTAKRQRNGAEAARPKPGTTLNGINDIPPNPISKVPGTTVEPSQVPTSSFERPELAADAIRRVAAAALSKPPRTKPLINIEGRSSSSSSSSPTPVPVPAMISHLKAKHRVTGGPTPPKLSASTGKKQPRATHPLAEEEEENTQDLLGLGFAAAERVQHDQGDEVGGLVFDPNSPLEFDDAQPPRRLFSASRSPDPAAAAPAVVAVESAETTQQTNSSGLSYITPPPQPDPMMHGSTSSRTSGLQRTTSLVKKMKDRRESSGKAKEDQSAGWGPIPRMDADDMRPYVLQSSSALPDGKPRRRKPRDRDSEDEADAPMSSIEQFSSPEKPASSTLESFSRLGRAPHPFSQVTDENDARLRERGKRLSEARKQAKSEREKARRRTIEEIGIVPSSDSALTWARLEEQKSDVRTEKEGEEEDELAEEMEQFVDFDGGNDEEDVAASVLDESRVRGAASEGVDVTGLAQSSDHQRDQQSDDEEQVHTFDGSADALPSSIPPQITQTQMGSTSQELDRLQKELTRLRAENRNLKTSLETLNAQQIARDELAVAREAEITAELKEWETERASLVQERDTLRQSLLNAETGQAAAKMSLEEEVAKLKAELAADRDARMHDASDRDAERNTLHEEINRLTLERDDAVVQRAGLDTRLETLKRQKEDAERSSEVFRDLYLRASGFADEVRAENKDLLQRAEVAEGRAEEGVAMVKGLYEDRLARLGEDRERWKVRAEIAEERERRTNADDLRQRAAEWGELKKKLGVLEEKLSAARAARATVANESQHMVDKLDRSNATLKRQAEWIGKLQDMLRAFAENAVGPLLQELAGAMADLDPGAHTDTTRFPKDPDEDTTDGSLDADGVVDDNNDDTGDWVFSCKYRDGHGGEVPCPLVFKTKEELKRHIIESPHIPNSRVVELENQPMVAATD